MNSGKNDYDDEKKKYLPYKRISEDKNYVRPDVTITDMAIDDNDFRNQKLDGYMEVNEDEIDLLPPGVKVRYITKNPRTDELLFRFGGVIKLVEKEYLVLIGANNVTFSVQRYIYNSRKQLIFKTLFYVREDTLKKLDKKRMEEASTFFKNGHIKNKIIKNEKTIEEQDKIIEEQNKIIEEYTKTNKKQKKQIEKLKTQLENC